MKSTLCALTAALALTVSSGCAGICDCLLGHHCGWGGGCDQCHDEGCSYCGPHCGACGCCGGGCSCPPGGCGDCGGDCGYGGPMGYAQVQQNRGPHGGPMGYAQVKHGHGPDGYYVSRGMGGRGCASCGANGCDPCRDCSPQHACSPIPDCCNNHQAIAAQFGGPAGPPSGQVTYPYYTTRGPRDFFANNPPSIGP